VGGLCRGWRAELVVVGLLDLGGAHGLSESFGVAGFGGDRSSFDLCDLSVVGRWTDMGGFWALGYLWKRAGGVTLGGG